MKIRSITCFCNPRWPLEKESLRQAGDFLQDARPAFETAGYEVQTTRLATPPFPYLNPAWSRPPASPSTETSFRLAVISLAQALEAECSAMGVDYISLGPAVAENPHSYRVIPEVLSATQSTFLAGHMTDAAGRLSLRAVHACAEVIQRNAGLSPDGFANLRFAALANVPPGSPFFPAAYHQGERPAFALATEAADLAVTAFTAAPGLEEGRKALIASIQNHAQALAAIAQDLSRRHGLAFGGIDFSLAPFPQQALSIGAAFERLGVAAAGLHGSLAAAAILAEAIDRAQFPRAGFSGLMFPLLEDAVLAQRAAEGLLSVTDLLLYSAVCGTGLDTLPLPGDVSSAELAALLLDLAALALRLDKPLTARLMPIPGKRAGEATNFDFAYFANSHVLALKAQPLQGFLAREAKLNLRRRGG
jgi:uncharacterized protein (UPF0210 family)